MKQEKKRTTLYLTPESDSWLAEKATESGSNKNAVIQALILSEMRKYKSSWNWIDKQEKRMNESSGE
jgi:hypothetical protein